MISLVKIWKNDDIMNFRNAESDSHGTHIFENRKDGSNKSERQRKRQRS